MHVGDVRSRSWNALQPADSFHLDGAGRAQSPTRDDLVHTLAPTMRG